MRWRLSTERLGYLGSRLFINVLGLKKWTLFLTFFTFLETAPFTAFATFSADGFAFGAIVSPPVRAQARIPSENSACLGRRMA
mmetsp:Transcript_69389/g.195852  ORF Transcript_69389/g.195852 Transcript_69389/m.195852 type:complete len:83 (+) Transcript_69389:2-250(+)